MSDVIAQPAAVFDVSAVSSLTGHADDHAFAHVFVARFRRLLPERVRRLDAALRSQERKEAMDAVRSLTVSSCTIGAGELALLGGRIEDHVRRSDYACALTAAAELPDAIGRVDEALAAFLDG
jgi:HPt (histidine-containing phosphotransfer) domain-containing protein